MRSGPIQNNDFHHYRNKGQANVDPLSLPLNQNVIVDPDSLEESAKKQKELNIHVATRSRN